MLVVTTRNGSRKTCVAMVTTIWKNQKKPVLACRGLSLAHVVAFRCIELQVSLENEKRFQCNENSLCWVLRPQTLVAILNFTSVNMGTDMTEVELTDKSVQVVEDTILFAHWWPEADEEEHWGSGLYVRKKRCKNQKKKKVIPETSEKDGEKMSEPKKSKTKKKKKKTKKPKETENAAEGEDKEPKAPKLKKKKAADLKEIAFVLENFKKKGVGPALILQTMQRLRVLEAQQFPDEPSFSAEDVCNIDLDKVKGTPWNAVKTSALSFFLSE